MRGCTLMVPELLLNAQSNVNTTRLPDTQAAHNTEENHCKRYSLKIYIQKFTTEAYGRVSFNVAAVPFHTWPFGVQDAPKGRAGCTHYGTEFPRLDDLPMIAFCCKKYYSSSDALIRSLDCFSLYP